MTYQHTHRDGLTAFELEQAKLAVELHLLSNPGLEPIAQENLFNLAIKLTKEAQRRHAEEVA